jgi:CheY-like chemotaxis protein
MASRRSLGASGRSLLPGASGRPTKWCRPSQSCLCRPRCSEVCCGAQRLIHLAVAAILLDRRKHLSHSEWLLEYATDAWPRERSFNVGLCGHDDDWELVAVFAPGDLMHERVSVHHRHHPIDEEEARAGHFIQAGEGLLTVASDPRSMARLLKRLPYALSNILVVFHYEDCAHLSNIGSGGRAGIPQRLSRIIAARRPLGRMSSCTWRALHYTARASSEVSMPVLVVDDDSDLRESLIELLKDAGFPGVHGAPDAAAALAAVRALRCPCVVVADVNLRGGITGRDLAAQLRALHDDEVRVVLMTGDSGSSITKDVEAVLYKPFDGAVLVSLVRRLLERR